MYGYKNIINILTGSPEKTAEFEEVPISTYNTLRKTIPDEDGCNTFWLLKTKHTLKTQFNSPILNINEMVEVKLFYWKGNPYLHLEKVLPSAGVTLEMAENLTERELILKTVYAIEIVELREVKFFINKKSLTHYKKYKGLD